MKPYLRSALQGSLAAVAILCFVASRRKRRRPTDTLVMAYVIDDMISLDPAEIYEFTASEYMANTYDRLVGHRSGQARRAEAAGWPRAGRSATTARPSPSRSAPGIKFHSGNDLTAEDVEFSLERFVKLNLNPAFILTQFGLTKDNVDDMVRVDDPMTLEVELDAAYAPSFFLNCLSYHQRRGRQEAGRGARGQRRFRP